MPTKSISEKIFIKIALNFSFWLCVGASFPLVSIFAYGMKITEILDDNKAIYIFSYFNSTQIYSTIAGVILFYFVIITSIGFANIIRFLLNSIRSRQKNMTSISEGTIEVAKELCSRLLSLGSIIMTINFFGFLASKILHKNIEFSKIPSTFTGITCWLLAIGLLIYSLSNEQQSTN